MPDTLPTKIDVAKFLFSERRTQFNIRREHEWKILFGFFALLAALDASQLSNMIHLTGRWRFIWISVVLLLAVGTSVFEFGLQRRNAVDRQVMNALKRSMWEMAGIGLNHEAMLPIEAEGEMVDHGWNNAWWAVGPQVIISVTLVALSCAIPWIPF